MKYTLVFLAATIIEVFLVYGFTYYLLRDLNKVKRKILILTLTFPGIFVVAGSGGFGASAPLPFILGAPIEILALLFGVKSLAWHPVIYGTIYSGFECPNCKMNFITEMAMLSGWAITTYLVIFGFKAIYKKLFNND